MFGGGRPGKYPQAENSEFCIVLKIASFAAKVDQKSVYQMTPSVDRFDFPKIL